MTTSRTPAQYRLGASIFHAIVDAYTDGATHEQVIATLETSVRIVLANQECEIPETALARQVEKAG